MREEDLHNWSEQKVDTVVPFISATREKEQNHLPLTQLLTYGKCKLSQGLVVQWHLLQVLWQDLCQSSPGPSGKAPSSLPLREQAQQRQNWGGRRRRIRRETSWTRTNKFQAHGQFLRDTITLPKKRRGNLWLWRIRAATQSEALRGSPAFPSAAQAGKWALPTHKLKMISHWCRNPVSGMQWVA